MLNATQSNSLFSKDDNVEISITIDDTEFTNLVKENSIKSEDNNGYLRRKRKNNKTKQYKCNKTSSCLTCANENCKKSYCTRCIKKHSVSKSLNNFYIEKKNNKFFIGERRRGVEMDLL